MENFYLIHECHQNRFRIYLNLSNSDLTKKLTEINRSENLTKKFVLVIEAVKTNCHNKTQYNFEQNLATGKVYAIKVDHHRLYTLQTINNGFRELFICRYGKKESQENTKKLKSIIDSIQNIKIQKLLQ